MTGAKRGGREKHERKNVPHPLSPIPFFSFLPFPYPPFPPPLPFFWHLPHGMRSLFALRARFRRFFSLSLNKPPARQAIKLTLKIRSTKMRCLEIARDSESLFFLITPLDCSGGVASLLQSPINRFCRYPAQTHSISLNGMLLFLVFFSFRHATHHG